jgi:prepilin-type N-terminal cleavage/methylation domain-containing protein
MKTGFSVGLRALWVPMYRESENGYTLLEITVVVAIVGIMGLLTVRPMKNYLRRLEFKNSSQNIKHLIQTVQSKAMANPNMHIGLYFDLASTPNRVIAFQDKANPTTYQYDGNADPAYLPPVALKPGTSFQALTGYPDEIVFRGDGSAWKSLKIVLTNGTLKDTLDVLASTGRVRVGR